MLDGVWMVAAEPGLLPRFQLSGQLAPGIHVALVSAPARVGQSQLLWWLGIWIVLCTRCLAQVVSVSTAN